MKMFQDSRGHTDYSAQPEDCPGHPCLSRTLHLPLNHVSFRYWKGACCSFYVHVVPVGQGAWWWNGALSGSSVTWRDSSRV